MKNHCLYIVFFLNICYSQNLKNTSTVKENNLSASGICYTTSNYTSTTSLYRSIKISGVDASSANAVITPTFTAGAVRAFNTTSASFTFSNAALTTPAGFVATGTPYCIKVRPRNVDGQDNLSYGTTCCLTSNTFKNSGTITSLVKSKEETTIFSVVAAPNPFKNGFQLHLTTPLDSKVQVAFYNVLGQLIENDSYTVEALENHLFAADLATGMYQVSIRQEEYNQVIKVIKN